MHPLSIPTTHAYTPIHPSPIIYIPRGGGANLQLQREPIFDGSALNDEELDQMVEDLIAGVDSDDGDETEDESESEEEEEEEEEETEEETEEEDASQVTLTEDSASEQEESTEEEDDDESADASAESLMDSSTKEQNDSTPDHTPTNNNEHVQSPMNQPAPTNNSSTPLSHKPTATNAYYRFLLRQGPKGHILASFTLLTVQWIHTYLPLLYNLASSTLLALRIYDPSQLEIKERERYLKEQRKKNKVSLGTKLKTKYFGNGQKKKTQLRDADVCATNKLQQLYNTVGSVDWKEVRYSYLSVGFRKRHGLGEEFVVKKPVRFMGESVGGELLVGDDEYEGDDDVVMVQEDMNLDEGALPDDVQKMDKQSRRKKKVTDWVVQSFSNQHFAPKKPSSTAPSSSIWKSVQKDAIRNAAWESRNAEKSIWANTNRRSNHGSSSSNTKNKNVQQHTANYSPSNTGASKMLQSVMTRVGSNGRILGAYPMDAYPIEECCNRRGVLDLARRYGYGDWSMGDNWDEKEEGDEDDSWGGGLFLEENDNVDLVGLNEGSGERARGSSRRSKSRKKKKKQVNNDLGDSTKLRQRRRRKKPQQT